MQKDCRNVFNIILLFLITGAVAFPQSKNTIYLSRNGRVAFSPTHPLKLIKATNTNLSGVLDINDRSFSFQIPIKAFERIQQQPSESHFE